jgi:hypothetical protein
MGQPESGLKIELSGEEASLRIDEIATAILNFGI